MGRLKIGLVLDDSLDTPDGVQQYILTLGAWLISKGHEVHYLVGQTARTDIPNVHSLSKNVRVQFNGNRMSTPMPANTKRVRMLLEKEKFDILHVQIPYSPLMAGRVIKSAPSSTAVVGTFHIAPNSGTVGIANKLLGKITSRSLKRFDAIVSVSSAAAQFALKSYGISTSVLPNMVKASHFISAEPIPFDDDRQTVVFLGRLVPRKGCQILLEAIDIIKKHNHVSLPRVVVCGRGPLEHDLKKYVKDHKLENTVSFVGFVDNKEKARYLKAANIAVFPSTGGESFGIVLLEAMAAEHPVVLGANNPGYASVLAPSPNSLFATHDPVALAAKLELFLTDKTVKNHTLAWQKTYIRQFDVSAVGSRIVSRYQEALRTRQNVR